MKKYTVISKYNILCWEHPDTVAINHLIEDLKNQFEDFKIIKAKVMRENAALFVLKVKFSHKMEMPFFLIALEGQE